MFLFPCCYFSVFLCEKGFSSLREVDRSRQNSNADHRKHPQWWLAIGTACVAARLDGLTCSGQPEASQRLASASGYDLTEGHGAARPQAGWRGLVYSPGSVPARTMGFARGAAGRRALQGYPLEPLRLLVKSRIWCEAEPD